MNAIGQLVLLFDDTEDILRRRNLFIGQVNSILCFFSDFDSLVKVHLFKAYCSSLWLCVVVTGHWTIIALVTCVVLGELQ